ncbi:MAG: DUF11 domain-containing protein [Oscillospiraceae bacterium]|jgi:uncharacterized repeat protein (TIGR01451 family)|nr:DUF11 domain-containing protein [Oscillospiraceae bacterium]
MKPKIKAKSAAVAALLVLIMILGQFSMLVTQSLAEPTDGSWLNISIGHLTQYTNKVQITIRDPYTGDVITSIAGGSGLTYPTAGGGWEGFCAQKGRAVSSGMHQAELLFGGGAAARALSATIKENMARTALFGYPNRPVSDFGLTDTAANRQAAHCATQMLIWESELGYRDANYNRTNNDIYNQLNYPEVVKIYNQIVEEVHVYLLDPSFLSTSTTLHLDLKWNSSTSRYEQTFQDMTVYPGTRRPKLAVVGANPNGIQVDISGSMYTFYAPSGTNPADHLFTITLKRTDIPYARTEDLGPLLLWIYDGVGGGVGEEAADQILFSGVEGRDRYYKAEGKIFLEPDIGMNKKGSLPQGSLLKAGTEIEYTIEVSNRGDYAVESYTVTDPLPAHVTLVPGSITAGGTYNATTRTITWVLKNIEIKETRELKFRVTADEMGLNECPRFIINVAFGEDGEHTNEWTYEQCASDLQLVKTADPPTGSKVPQGGTITYTLTVYNSGPQDSGGNVVRDTIPPGTSYVAGSGRLVTSAGAPGDFTASAAQIVNGEIVWDNVFIKAGKKAVFEFKVTVDALDKGVQFAMIQNQPYLNNIPGNPTWHFVYSGVLNAVKTSVPPSGSIVKVGSNITYTVTIYNSGPDVIRDITVTDQTPDGTTLLGTPAPTPTPNSITTLPTGHKKLTWLVPVLQGNEEKSFSFTVHVDELPDGVKFRTLENVATVDDSPTNQTTHYVGSANIIGVKKSIPITGTTVYENDIITYLVEVTNTGSEPAYNTIVTDQLPDNLDYVPGSLTNGTATMMGGTITGTYYPAGTPQADTDGYNFYWVISELKPLESTVVRFQAKVKVMPQGISQREFRNVAYVNGINTNETEHYQYAGSKTAVKYADPVENSIVHEDTVITYYIDVFNPGADTTYNIPAQDSIPAGTVYVPNSISVKIDGTEDTASAKSFNSADNSLNWNIKALAAGKKAVLSFQVKVERMPENLDKRIIDNVAKVADFETNHVIHNQTNYFVYGVKSADKTTSSRLHEGETVTYTIEVMNKGSEEATKVLVRDKIPLGTTYVAGSASTSANVASSGTLNAGGELTWTIASIPPNGTETITFQVTTNALPEGDLVGTINNFAYVDEIVTNTVTHTVGKDLPLYEKTAVPPTESDVIEGQRITYKIQVQNVGDMKSRNLVVTDQVPVGTTLVPGSISHGGTESGGTITWNFATWSVGEIRELTFEVIVDRLPAGTGSATITNLATVDGSETNVVRHHVKKPVLEYSKSAAPKESTAGNITRVRPGDIITYTITVRNVGTLADTNVQIIDAIPAGTTYVPGSLTGTGDGTGKYEASTGRVIWTIPRLEPTGAAGGTTAPIGGEVYVTFKVRVNPLAYGQLSRVIKNHAVIYGYDTPGENTNEAEHTVVPYLIDVDKIADPPDGSVVAPGQQIKYTITVTNHSGDLLEYLPVWDTVPLGTTYVPGSASDGGRLVREENHVTNRVEWVLRFIEPGDSYTLTFKVTADPLPEGEYARKAINVAIAGEGGTKDKPGIPDVPSNEVEHEITQPKIVPTKSADPADGSEVYVGQTVTYTVALKNVTDKAIAFVPVRDTIPQGTTLKAGSITAGGLYNNATKNIDWVIPSIAPGATETVSFAVTVNELPFGKSQGRIDNVAYTGNGGGTADDPGLPTIPSNEVSHYVILPPVEGTKSAEPPTNTTIYAGKTVQYTITVTNRAAVAVENIPVYDYIPAETSYVTGSADNAGLYDPSYNWVQWVIPLLAAGDSIDLHFEVTAGQLKSGETEHYIYNTAIVSGSATQQVIHKVVRPDVYGEKSADPVTGSMVEQDDVIEYSIEVFNHATSPRSNLIVTDQVPQYTAYVAASATQNPALGIAASYNAGSGVITWTINSIPAGGSVVLKFKVTADPLNTGELERTLVNRAVVDNLATNPVYHYVKGKNALNTLKTSNPAPGTEVVENDVITYIVTVTNDDVLPATGTVITDAIPAGTQYYAASPAPAGSTGGYIAAANEMRWTIATLAPGATMAFTFRVKVLAMPQNLIQRTILNRAFINNRGTNQVMHFQKNAPISAYKSADPPSLSRVLVGAEILYTIRVENPGAAAVTNVVVLDYIPAGTTYVAGSANAGGAYDPGDNLVRWTIASVAPGATETVTFKVKVSRLPDGRTSAKILNVALVNGAPTNQTVHDVASPHIVATKSAEPPHLSEVLEGQVIRYTITVKNTGDVADYNIKVKDLVPQYTTLIKDSVTNGGVTVAEEITWIINTLEAGAEKHLSFDVYPNQLPEGLARRKIENTALYGQGGEDPETPTNTVIHNVNKARVIPFKSAVPASGSTVRVGSYIEYTVGLRNEGTLMALNTLVYDEIPAGTTFVPGSIRGNGYYNAALNRVEWSVTNIQAGSTAFVGFTVRANPLPAGETELEVVNVAIVDDKPTNEVTHTVVPPVLGAVKSADPPHMSEVAPEDIITYYITFTNNGTGTIYNIPVIDTVPVGTTFVPESATPNGVYYPPNRRITWQIPSLASGASITLSFQVTVDDLPALMESREIINTAYYNEGGGTPINPGIPDLPTNDVIHIAYPMAFSAEKTASPESGQAVKPGDTVDFTITVRNYGPKPMLNVPVTDVLSTYFDFISADSGGTFNPITRQIAWNIPTIPALHGTASVTFRVRANNLTPGESMRTIYNIAYAKGKPTNTTVHYVMPDDPEPDHPYVQVAKDATPTTGSNVLPGDTITYRLTVSNIGLGTAQSLVVEDLIPVGTTYVPGSADHGGSYSTADKKVIWSLGSMAGGATPIVLSFQVTVDSLGELTYRQVVNKGTVSYLDGATPVTRDSNPVNHEVNPIPDDFIVTKTANPEEYSTVAPGTEITYTVTVTNLSPAPMTNVTIYDPIPAYTTYVANSADNGGVLVGGQVVWTIPTIAANGTAQVTFRAKMDQLQSGIFQRTVHNSAYATSAGKRKYAPEVIHYVIAGDTGGPRIGKKAVPVTGSTVEAGTEIAYSITVTNGSTNDLLNMNVRDSIPANTTYVSGSANPAATFADNALTWTIAKIEPGKTVEVTFKVKTLALGYNYQVTNTAQLLVPGGTWLSDQVTHYVTGETPPVNASKSAIPSSGSPVETGDVITYAINIQNPGTSPVTNIRVNDIIPAGTSYIPGSASDGGTLQGGTLVWNISGLAAGTIRQLTFQATVTGTDNVIRNHATVSVNNATAVETNETAHYMATTENLTVTKRAIPAAGSVVHAGDEITYYLDIKNNGTSAATNVRVFDYLPKGVTYVQNTAIPNGVLNDVQMEWIIASIAAGRTTSVTFRVKVDDLPDGVNFLQLRNQGHILESDGPHYSNVVLHNVIRDTNTLQMIKTASPVTGSTVQKGATIRYTITVTNNSSMEATNILVEDPLPANTAYVADSASDNGTLNAGKVQWTIASLSPGQSKALTFSVTVNGGDWVGLLENTATATYSGQTIRSNPTHHYPGTTNQVPVQVLKRSAPPSGSNVSQGETITYYVDVFNYSDSPLANVQVFDDIPAGTEYQNGTATNGGSLENSSGRLHWVLTNIPARESVTVSFQVTVGTLPQGSSARRLSNQAYALTSDGPAVSNRVSHEQQAQGAVTPISVSKTALPASGSPVLPNQLVTYTITVSNPNSQRAEDIDVYDPIPAGTVYEPNSADNGGILLGGSIYWHVNRLNANQSVTFHFSVRVLSSAQSTIQNVAQATYGGRTVNSNATEHYPGTANYAFSKGSTPIDGSTVQPGDVIIYHLYLTNTGTSNLTNVLLEDIVPGGTKYQEGSGQYTVGGGDGGAIGNYAHVTTLEGGQVQLTWLIPSVAPGDTVHAFFEAVASVLPAGTSGVLLRNVGESVVNGISRESNEVIINVGTPPPHPIQLTKTASPPAGSQVTPNSEIAYTLTVRNPGTAPVNNILVSDPVPAGTSYVSGSGGILSGGNVTFQIAQLAGNETRTLTFKVKVDSAAATGAVILNTAQATAESFLYYSNPIFHSVNGQMPLVSATLSSNPINGSLLPPGSTVRYSVVLVNNGSSPAYNIPVRNPIPAGASYANNISAGGSYNSTNNEVSWTVASIAPGASQTVWFEVTVNANNSTTPGIIRDTAYYTPNPSGSSEAATNEIIIVVPPADEFLSGSKISNPPSNTTVTAGQEITYTLTVYNDSTLAATNVTVGDTLPEGLGFVNGSASDGGTYAAGTNTVTWIIPTLGGKQSKSVSFRAVVLPLPAGANSVKYIRNTPVVNGKEGNEEIVVNPGSFSQPHTDGYLFTAPVSKSRVQVGDTITYTIMAINNGNTDLTDVPVRIPVPSGTVYLADSATDGGVLNAGEIRWTIPSLLKGTTKNVSFTVTVQELGANQPFRVLDAIAYVGGPNGERNTNQVFHTQTTSPAQGDLLLQKSAGRANYTQVQVGDTITYSLTVTNLGSAARRNITITDTIPAGTTFVEGSASDGGVRTSQNLVWNLASLGAGASKTVSFQATVNAPATEDITTVIHNQAFVNGTPGNAVDNPVYQPSFKGVGAMKHASPAAGTAVTQGDVITYSIDVTNLGAATVTGTTVTDEIPAGTTLVEGSIDNGGTISGRTITWAVGALSVGQVRTLSFKVTVNALGAGEEQQPIRNQATVSGPGGSGSVPSNPVYHSNQKSSISLEKFTNTAVNQVVSKDDVVTFTLRARNNSGLQAKNVAVTDAIPEGTSYVANSASANGTYADGIVTWIIASLAPYASTEVSFQAKVTNSETGTIRNVAYAGGSASNPVVLNKGTKGPGGTDPSNPGDGCTCQPTNPGNPTNPGCSCGTNGSTCTCGNGSGNGNGGGACACGNCGGNSGGSGGNGGSGGSGGVNGDINIDININLPGGSGTGTGGDTVINVDNSSNNSNTNTNDNSANNSSDNSSSNTNTVGGSNSSGGSNGSNGSNGSSGSNGSNSSGGDSYVPKMNEPTAIWAIVLLLGSAAIIVLVVFLRKTYRKKHSRS